MSGAFRLNRGDGISGVLAADRRSNQPLDNIGCGIGGGVFHAGHGFGAFGHDASFGVSGARLRCRSPSRFQLIDFGHDPLLVFVGELNRARTGRRERAEEEAGAIVAEAKAEAERYAVEARASIKTQIERRGRQAEEKIAQAEAQAIAEVRALAADAAVAAAEKLITARLDDNRSADLIKRSLGEIPSKLN